jgi:hypothetical protein
MTHPNHPMQLVWGLTIWAIWFVTVYGGLSVACAATEWQRESPLSLNNALLLLTTLPTVLLLIWLMKRCWRARQPAPGYRRFIAAVSAALYAASALATVAIAVPIMLLPPCV